MLLIEWVCPLEWLVKDWAGNETNLNLFESKRDTVPDEKKGAYDRNLAALRELATNLNRCADKSRFTSRDLREVNKMMTKGNELRGRQKGR